MEKEWKQWETLFWGAPKSLQMVCDRSHEIKRPLLLGSKAMTNLDSILKSRDTTLPTKVHLSSQGYGFSSGHVWMWELDHKESWVPKNWCFWTVVLEKTLERPLDCKEIQPVHPKRNQSWIFIVRTDAETPKLWPPDMKKWPIGKDPDAGKDWRQEDMGMTEDEMVGWHHQLDGQESEQAPGVGDRQRSLLCCSHGVIKSQTWLSDWTELNRTSQVAPVVKNLPAKARDIKDSDSIPGLGRFPGGGQVNSPK